MKSMSKSTPYINVILKENNEVVHSTKAKSKVRVFNFVQGKNFENGYVKVTYPRGKEYYNHADFESTDELKSLLGAFLERELVAEFS